MVGTENGSELAHPRAALLDAFLVEIVAEEVDAVGAGEIEEAIAVEVRDGGARGALEKHPALQVLAHHAAELKRHAIARGELQVRHRRGDLAGERGTLGEALRVERCEAHERLAPLRSNFRRRIVRAEEARLVVLVMRDEPRDESRETRVPAERAVLGEREPQPQLRLAQQDQDDEGAGDVPEHHGPAQTISPR